MVLFPLSREHGPYVASDEDNAFLVAGNIRAVSHPPCVSHQALRLIIEPGLSPWCRVLDGFRKEAEDVVPHFQRKKMPHPWPAMQFAPFPITALAGVLERGMATQPLMAYGQRSEMSYFLHNTGLYPIMPIH
jgi:hypothetical protein